MQGVCCAAHTAELLILPPVPLQTIFDEVILPTHKTKYVQFLLFRMCCVDPELPSVFVDFLKSKLLNASNSIPDRQASVCGSRFSAVVGMFDEHVEG